MLATQLLELSKQLASSGKSFKLTLNMKHISFTCSSQGSDLPANTTKRIKKKSPSTKNRDSLRRNTFLEKKMEQTNNMSNSPEETKSTTSFPCDLCDFSATSRKDLNIHMVNQHKDLEQLDGNATLNSTTDEDKDQDRNTEVIKKPPAKLMHPTHGIGTFRKIDITSGHCVYDFPNGTSLMRDSVETL